MLKIKASTLFLEVDIFLIYIYKTIEIPWGCHPPPLPPTHTYTFMGPSNKLSENKDINSEIEAKSLNERESTISHDPPHKFQHLWPNGLGGEQF